MIAFNFYFSKDPTDEEGDKPLRVNVIANSEEEAWQATANQLDLSVEYLRKLGPTIQMKHLQAGEIVVSREHRLTDLDDPWPQIVSDGIKDVTGAIKDTVGSAHKDRIQVALAQINIDRLIIVVFSIAFLGSLAFAFYLITIDRQEPVFNFVFPIITAVIGLISGYFAGRRSTSDSSRQ